MHYLLGLSIACGSLYLAFLKLGVSPAYYFDEVALLTVLGGTTAVAVITLPWNLSSDMLRCFRYLLGGLVSKPKTSLANTARVVQSRGTIELKKESGLANEILRDGIELIGLGFKKRKIESILGERIYQYLGRLAKIGTSIRGLAKYPPAFGLVGTVFGLVSLMRSISETSNSQEIGSKMAVALISTLYGLLLSNLIINPAGEKISAFTLQEKKEGELALQGVLLATERQPFLEANEILNSFVMKEDRLTLSSSKESERDQVA